MTDKIQLIEAIVKGGVAVILSIGLLVLFGINAYLQTRQLELMEEQQRRQTEALEDIARTYAGP